MSIGTALRGAAGRPPAECGRPVPEPERLACDARLGPLLEQTNARYRAGLDEGVAFRRLLQRVAKQPPLAARDQRRQGWPVLAVLALGGLSAGAALCLLLMRSGFAGRSLDGRALDGTALDSARLSSPSSGDTPRIVFGPERRRSVPSASQSDTPSSPGEQHAASARVPRAHAPLDTKVTTPAREGDRSPREPAPLPERPGRAAEPPPRSASRATHARSGLVAASDEPSSAAPQPTAPPAASASSPPAPPVAAAQADCLGLARTGQAHAAERCFSERASGSGLSAEMALYEVARLRRDVLHDATGALSALREHGQRFPRGSLRNEVELSRVELLAELGRTQEALLESEALLTSESGRERAAELHVLRGNVYHRDLGDPRSAAAEYARAEAGGGALGAEATRLRGACLEALGDVDGALRAYRQYTGVPGQPHAAEVLRQIQRLSPLARQPGSTP